MELSQLEQFIAIAKKSDYDKSCTTASHITASLKYWIKKVRGRLIEKIDCS